MQNIRLRNGVDMPQLGIDTSLIPEDKMTEAIGKAYELGYQLFDTCGNEWLMARALRENGIKREDVFITAKVDAYSQYWGGYRHGNFNIRKFRPIRSVVRKSFKHLETDYVDLFLIHGACPIAKKVWLELSYLYCDRRIRAMGVSNFLQPHLDALAEYSDFMPTVNQLEISPLNTKKELLAYCQQRGIVISYCGLEELPKELMENGMLKEIASRHKKTVVQIVLRWMQQQNIVMISKAWDKAHLEESISIFDFELSDEEMNEIGSIRS
jgi:diketogulonate reductase-like aldo/keto reductase